MVLENKLGIENSSELARLEEQISKKKAAQLFETGQLFQIEVGTFAGLANIHQALFEDIYDFAGKIRDVNLAKDNFQFAPRIFLEQSLVYVDKLPHETFEEIIEKYVEMNVAQPFREGNGRSMRLWLDHLLKSELGQVVDWSLVDKEDYLLAMERSPIRDIEIKYILKNTLTDEIDSRELYMKGIDHSFYYEGYNLYRTEDLKLV
ncbi:cell filamentation protein Fic [Streptococcus suis]|nr:cell filamentation protein Fic [Streptococcus suis]